MATGKPTRSKGGAWSEIALTYPGKINADRVLATPPTVVLKASDGPLMHEAALILGENLAVLAALRRNPSVSGKVDLIYIDPPYATETSFSTRDQQHAYHDSLTGPAYVEFIRQRIILMHDLLAETGSIYVHIDSQTMPYVKMILDEVFGTHCFRNIISRRKCNPKNYTRQQFGNVIDYILLYSKSRKATWNRPLEERSASSEKEYSHVDSLTGRRYMKVPIHAPGTRQGATGQQWRGINPPPGKHWQYTPDRLDELDAAGDIVWSASGNPRRKVYLDERQGVPVQDLWLEFRDAHNQMVRVTGYPTEKPEDMLRLIIEASSNEGDLVLDAFAGSGTTLAVASRLKRRWIGIDESGVAIAAAMRRFNSGLTPMGDFSSERTRRNAQSELFGSIDSAKTIRHERVDFSLWSTQCRLVEAVELDDASINRSEAA